MSSWFSCSPEHPQPPTTSTKPAPMSPTLSLLHYEPGSTPPSARVDAKFKLQPRRPLRIWDYWKLAPILAAKATEVTSDVLSHHIWGPRRRTWGIEMTILNSIFRGADRHIALADIGTIRLLMSLIGLVPVPSDALVTPVSFKVKRRNLRGFLADLDEKEDGSRELSGEWVVGRKTWQRMQKEWKASMSGSPPSQASSTSSTDTPKSQKRKEHVVLYIHGGAYYLSSAASMRVISIPLAKYTDSRVFALDYRLAPETHFPGPLHDVVSAYFRLIEELHIPPENIIVSGDSAGGALSLALLLYLRDNAYPLPSGAVLMSPWVDLTMSCESWDTNAPFDVVPFPVENHMNPIALYLGERAEEYLTHPYASPLFGDFKGLPPLLIQAGDAEVLRDEIRLLAHKASSAGVQVMYELYDDAIHVFHAYPFLEVSRRAFESMHAFVRIVLPQHWTRSPQLLATTTERGLEQEIENDRTVVVAGDGAEQPSSRGKHSQMAEFTESRQENETGNSTGGTSWVPSLLWRLGSKPRKESEQVEHLADLDMEELQLSPSSLLDQSPSASFSPLNTNVTFIPNVSPMLSRPRSPSVLPDRADSLRDPRRIQSASSLSALHFNNTEESIACPPNPPPTFTPSSAFFRFNVFSPSSPLPRVEHQSHRRSKSSAQVPQLISSSDQQQWVYPPSPSPWPIGEDRRLMMAGREKPFYLTDVTLRV